jgi:hypothetical protein
MASDMDNSDFYESSHAGMTDSMCLVIYIGNLAGGGQGLRRFEERRRREAMGSKGKGLSTSRMLLCMRTSDSKAMKPVD